MLGPVGEIDRWVGPGRLAKWEVEVRRCVVSNADKRVICDEGKLPFPMPPSFDTPPGSNRGHDEREEQDCNGCSLGQTELVSQVNNQMQKTGSASQDAQRL